MNKETKLLHVMFPTGVASQQASLPIAICFGCAVAMLYKLGLKMDFAERREFRGELCRSWASVGSE